MPDGFNAGYDEWVLTVFGIDPRGPGKPPPLPPRKPMALAPATPGGAIDKAAHDPAVWTRSVGEALTRQGPDKPGARIEAPVSGPGTVCTGKNGRTVDVAQGPDGRVALTRTPPPVKEITFAGGGGKGNALPGAVHALAESGVLQGVSELHGASVGSITAALLAAGVTPEAFQHFSDDTKFGPLIKGNDLLMLNVSGEGPENLVRDAMGSGIKGQIAQFQTEAMKQGTKVDPKTLQAIEAITEKLNKGGGPTFMDLRVLHGIIPAIKEVVITGTLKGKSKPGGTGEMEAVPPEMTVFSADTQPDLEVALAVHASAALPGVFKPVDLKLQGGETGRFEDGGVTNNVPTGDSLGLDRNVDPVPDGKSMSFVFEDEAAHDILKGRAKPDRSAINQVRDKLLGSDMSAAELDTGRGLAERPEDVVMIPLTFERPGGKKADFAGNKGTLAFDMKKDDRVKLQAMSKEATSAFLKKRQEPETRSFASVAEMLSCTTRDDLQAMADSEFPGAAEALQFRDGIDAQVQALEVLAAKGAGATDGKAQAILKAMTEAAGGDPERVGLIGRALNRSGKLDGFMVLARGKAGGQPDALAAGLAVAAVLDARKEARMILRSLVGPKMVREDPKGVSGVLLGQMQSLLQDARSGTEINRALRMGIAHFSRRFDPGGVLGHKDFAVALTKQLQPDD